MDFNNINYFKTYIHCFTCIAFFANYFRFRFRNFHDITIC